MKIISVQVPFKIHFRWGNPPLCNRVIAVPSGPKSHTFTIILAVFIPQPRWCHKPGKDLLSQLVKRVINVVAGMITPSVYCMVSWGVMINSQQLPNARKFLSLISWNYPVYNLIHFTAQNQVVQGLLDVWIFLKANVTYLSAAVTL